MEQNEENVSSKSETSPTSTTPESGIPHDSPSIHIDLSRNKQSLNLSNKSIEEIPKEVFSITTLTNLNLSHNLIAAIPSDIKKLTNLKVLDISSNKLTSLPNELGNHIFRNFTNHQDISQN
jgi:Leucine-rich repeat (LRR) protein